MKLYRPTETTKFHIDRAWFEKNGMDFRIAVYKCLTPEQQERVGEPNAAEVYDYVNETTGEVERVDTVLRAVRVEGARRNSSPQDAHLSRFLRTAINRFSVELRYPAPQVVGDPQSPGRSRGLQRRSAGCFRTEIDSGLMGSTLQVGPIL
jgi:hypothetical protein